MKHDEERDRIIDEIHARYLANLEEIKTEHHRRVRAINRSATIKYVLFAVFALLALFAPHIVAWCRS